MQLSHPSLYPTPPTPPTPAVPLQNGPIRVESRRVRAGGTHLHYLAAGDGPSLVLVHGFSASSTWWRDNIPGLARGHRVYALDLAGFGRSWPKRHFSLDHGVEQVVAWMEALGLTSADFCGHSMGGHLCMHLAAAHPERVRRIVLAAASGLPLGRSLLPLAWRGLRSSGHTHFRFAPTVVRTSLQAGPLVLWTALRDLLADDVRHVIEGVSAPTLLVWGERDVLVPLELGRVLHQAIPGSRLSVMPETGHNLMLERPAEFNRLVLEFLG